MLGSGGSGVRVPASTAIFSAGDWSGDEAATGLVPGPCTTATAAVWPGGISVSEDAIPYGRLDGCQSLFAAQLLPSPAVQVNALMLPVTASAVLPFLRYRNMQAQS